MKNITMNIPALCAMLVVAGGAGLAAGAFLGYGQGYKQGDVRGRHEAATPLMALGAGPQEQAVLVGYGPQGEAVRDCLVPAGTVVIGKGKAEQFAFRSSTRHVAGEVTSETPSSVTFKASRSLNADGSSDQTHFALLTYPAEAASGGSVAARPGYECAHAQGERSEGSGEAVRPFGH